MTRHFRVQDSYPAGPLQLEQIQIGPQLHDRIR